MLVCYFSVVSLSFFLSTFIFFSIFIIIIVISCFFVISLLLFLSYSGIGRETVRVFAKLGANVILAGRDVAKGSQVVVELKGETGKESIFR